MDSMDQTDFAKKFTADSGILKLMDDLGKAMAGGDIKYMFGGGNPANIPEVNVRFDGLLKEIASTGQLSTEALHNYDTPQGNAKFIKALVSFLNDEYGWNVSEKNIAITPGSQTGFFILFNLLSDKQRHIQLPLVPEYIGYLDQAIHNGAFKAAKPAIVKTGSHQFKYQVDFEGLEVTDDTAALCLSRPTNPTGNVVTEEELEKLQSLADEKEIPLIIDCAYGDPFPGIVRQPTQMTWTKNRIITLSLSKIGLPGARTGIIIAPEEIASAVTKANAIIALANPNIGQLLMEPLLRSGEVKQLITDKIQPFYMDKADFARQTIEEVFDDSLPYYLHEHEGSFFFWLWLEDLPIPTKELYQRLKQRGVLVVPGEYFFTDVGKDWKHQYECLRLNIARPKKEVTEGMTILAEEIANSYRR
ncbi:MAG: valine--pyruvate transaminase [Candidatus Saccharimonadales bacterium]|nr:valine--pyruvate transaminase [Candidatus Saccharimonadales bacterium]